MEIERLSRCPIESPRPLQKQRKSPENGDWKTLYSFAMYFTSLGNKENLLKMEIESRKRRRNNFRGSVWETKKISWKWRLKVSYDDNCTVRLELLETKKISWKWRLKVNTYCPVFQSIIVLKQRKSPENGDWKSIFLNTSTYPERSKQRKSPENGDWKFGLFINISSLSLVWNKENLLKMEIERPFRGPGPP